MNILKNWKDCIISPDRTMFDVLNIMNESALQIAIVTENNKILGIVTDGDIRRALLKGMPLTESVSFIMNKTPVKVNLHDSKSKILSIMREKNISHIPVVDEFDNIVYLETLNNLLQATKQDNLVIIMAGGMGTRLYPLTENCPKPMLRVGTKPILEIILENFMSHGFYNFCFAVNYKASMIKEYFSNGENFGVNISYIEEEKRLGTAGALSLLKEIPKSPVIVVNGDILTNANYSRLLEYQNETNADAVMWIREYSLQVPFGVVEFEDNKLKKIVEKPSHDFFVSAGMYVLKPEVIKLIPENCFFDMPKLFDLLIENNYDTRIFSINEYWIDIGQKDDYERANREKQ